MVSIGIRYPSFPYPFSVTAGAAVPTVLLWADPILVSPGQPTTLTWATGNATSCQASGGWSGSQTLNDSGGISPTPMGTTGLFNLGDVLVIQRKVLGLVTFQEVGSESCWRMKWKHQLRLIMPVVKM